MSRTHLSQSTQQTIRILLAVVPTLMILGILNATVLSGPAAPAVPCIPGTPNVVGGVVFQDDNASGARSVLPARPNEAGVGGVTVTAYDVNNTPLASIVTDPDGTYVLNIPDGTNVRIEFTNYPAGYFSGPFGADSATSVTFVQSPNCSVDLGLVIPSQVCPTNPELATNCYVSGYQLTRTLPVLVSFPYTAGGVTLVPSGNQPPPADEADSDQAGTTWGLAHQRQSNSLFAAAFMKRHTGFGPGGTGAIYRINRTLAPGNPSRATVFLDLNALFGSTGADPHPLGTDFNRDPLSWDAVGKISLGDIDISEDEQTLWAVSLNDRQLYEIPIGVPPVAPPAGSIGRFPVPSPTDCPNPATDIRPFAVGVNRGLVYVGMVCSAESTVSPGNPQGDRTQLRAYVYSFNPTTDTFAQVLNFRLDYTRGCAVTPGCVQAGAGGFGQADWLPWITTFGAIPTFYSSFPTDRLFVYPQPMLTDIVFDGGDMVLGIRDRYGDQMGYLQYSPNPGDNNLYSGVAAGDIVRACANGLGGWTLESNGSCGSTTTGGAGNGQGIGGGEYYYQEDTASIPPPDSFSDHDEVSLAGLAQLPGYSETLETVYDIFQIYDGGILSLNNVTGQRIRGYQVLTLTQPPITFGKAAGLGDLEVMCGPPPIEIGNRVWRDMAGGANNGRQDATDGQEYPLPGVTVNLYDASGNLIATTLTDANGEYIFNASNVPGGLLPFMTYTVRLDNPTDYTIGALAGMTLTLSNAAGVPDTIDNDGVLGVTGYPEIVVVTGAYNDNQHTYDFGFYDIPTAVGLLYFRVDGVSGRRVSLSWATEVEIDSFGFNVYRSPENNFSRATWVHFEPSAGGGGGSGATYAYQDMVPADGVWWYWLGDVDTGGNETLHGPRTAMVGPDALLPYRVYLPAVFNRQP